MDPIDIGHFLLNFVILTWSLEEDDGAIEKKSTWVAASDNAKYLGD